MADGKVRGKSLSKNQRGFFGSIAGGLQEGGTPDGEKNNIPVRTERILRKRLPQGLTTEGKKKADKAIGSSKITELRKAGASEKDIRTMLGGRASLKHGGGVKGKKRPPKSKRKAQKKIEARNIKEFGTKRPIF